MKISSFYYIFASSAFANLVLIISSHLLINDVIYDLNDN
jgi:hypothetical protein